MEIQIKKKIPEKEEAGIYFLIGDAKAPVAVPIGKMRFEKGVGIYKGKFPAEKIGGTDYDFDEVTGLYLESGQEIFASQWVEESLLPGKVRILKKENHKKENDERERNGKEDSLKEAVQDRRGDRTEKGPRENTLQAAEEKPLYDWRYEWERLDSGPGNELVLGLALWTRNKGKS